LNAPLIAVFAGSSFAYAWALQGQRGLQAAAAPAVAFFVVLLLFPQLRILDAFSREACRHCYLWRRLPGAHIRMQTL
jgi:hypothetical protein